MKYQLTTNTLLLFSIIFLFINPGSTQGRGSTLGRGDELDALSFLDSAMGRDADETENAPQNVKINEVDKGTWLVTWNALDGATAYKTRIYTTNHIKYKEEGPLFIPVAQISDLDPTKEYYLTVTAMQYTELGMVEGPESEPVNLNNVGCPNNQVYLPCTSHCVSTCDNPEQIPICNRMCVPGCGCPRELPTLDNGFCMKPYHCPLVSRSVDNPTNLRVVSAEDTKIVLTWDPVQGASEYKLQVFLNVNRHEALHTQYVPYPIAEVAGLQPDTAYIFRVTTIRGKADPSSFRSSKVESGSGSIETQFQARSMTVGWEKDEEARRYGVVLYEGASDGGQIEVVMKEDNIATPELELDGLKPGTTYTIAVQSAKAGQDLKDEIAVSSFTTPAVDEEEEVYGENVFVTKTTGLRVKEEVVVEKPTEKPETELTNCQKAAIAKVEEDEETFDCRADGNYVTVRCGDVTDDVMTIPQDCWCVYAISGRKVPGSDFNMKYLQEEDILLNCDTYGQFAASEREIFIQQVFPDKVTIGWETTTKERQDEVTAVLVRVHDINYEMIEFGGVELSEDFVVGGLSPGQTYKISVQALNENGDSTPAGWSTLLEIETPEVQEITKPANVQVRDARHVVNENAAQEPGLELSWDDQGSSVSYYVRAINYGNPGKPVTTERMEVSGNQVLLKKLSPFVPYKIEISARGYGGVASDAAVVTVDRLCVERPLDVIFAIDVSWIGNGNWINFHYKKEVTAKVASNLPTDARVAVVRYYKDSSRVADFGTWSNEDGSLNAELAQEELKKVKWNGTRTLKLSTLFSEGKGMVEMLSPDYEEERFTLREEAIPVVVFLSGTGPKIDPWDVPIFNEKSQLMYDNAHVIAVGASFKMSRDDVTSLASSDEHAIWLNKKLSSGFRHQNYVQEAYGPLSKLLCLS